MLDFTDTAEVTTEGQNKVDASDTENVYPNAVMDLPDSYSEESIMQNVSTLPTSTDDGFTMVFSHKKKKPNAQGADTGVLGVATTRNRSKGIALSIPIAKSEQLFKHKSSKSQDRLGAAMLFNKDQAVLLILLTNESRSRLKISIELPV